VIVDDQVPYYAEYSCAYGAVPRNNKFWPMIAEKAWAKLHGSYMTTNGGQTTNVFTHLAGYPSFYVDHTVDGFDWDMLWKRLMKADDRDYCIMT